MVKRLEVGCEDKISFKYIGVSITQEGEKVMMSHYSRRIKVLDRWHFRGERRLLDGEQSMYCSLLGQLNWLLQHTQSDL